MGPKDIDEDAGTERIVARMKADMRAGRFKTIPGDVVHAIVDGKNALRVVREWRKMTQTELGDKFSGVGQTEVSALESGKRHGTAATWKKLAKALDVPMEIIVPE